MFIEKIKERKIFLICVLIISIIIGVIYVSCLVPRTYISSTTIMIIEKEKIDEQNYKNKGNVELSNNMSATVEELLESNIVVEKIKTNLKISDKFKIDVRKKADSNTFSVNVHSLSPELSTKISNELNTIISSEIKNINMNYDIYIIDSPQITEISYSTNPAICILISFLFGVLFDIIYVVVVIISEKYDNQKKNVEIDVSLNELIRLPFKNIKNPDDINEIITNDESISMNTALRRLRANIQFLNVAMDDKKTIFVTSPLKKEGKTFVAINLAVIYAEISKKVVLIDFNFSENKFKKVFNITSKLGVSNYLSGIDDDGVEINKDIDEYLNQTQIKNLTVISVGTIPPNPKELLASSNLEKMLNELSKKFDIIILDGEETLQKPESLIIANKTGSTILVADNKNTKYEDLIKAKSNIQNVGGRVIGVVINKVDLKNIKKLANGLKSTRLFLKSILHKIRKYIFRKMVISQNRLLNEKNEIKEENGEDVIKSFDENTIENNVVDEDIINESNHIEDDKNEDISNVIEHEENNNEIKNHNKKNKEIKKHKKASSDVDKTKQDDIENAIVENEEDTDKDIDSLNDDNEEKKSSLGALKKKIIKFTKKENKNEDIYTNIKNEAKKFDSNEVLVVVDGETGYVGAYNKENYIEKLIRGVDEEDGYIKAYYSLGFVNELLKRIMAIYNIPKKDSKRIDPVVYAILADFDEKMWITKNIDTSFSEKYALLISKDYTKSDTENIQEYNERTRLLRKIELKKRGIEIKYNLSFDGNNDLNILDKTSMKKYSELYGKEELDNETLEKIKKEIEQEYKIANMENLKKNSILMKNVNELDNSRKKSRIEESADLNIEKENNENYEDAITNINLYKTDLYNESLFEIEKDYEADKSKMGAKLDKQEKKQEKEILKKVKKERRQKQREEEKKKKEEIKKEQEIEKEESKKINEINYKDSFFEENLYPKTKNLKI